MNLNPKRRELQRPSAIKATSTNLTIYSGAAAAIVTAGTFIFESALFDEEPPVTDEIKKDVVVALALSFGLIAAADLIARAMSKAATDRAWSTVAAASVESGAFALQPTFSATKTKGQDQHGFTAIARRAHGSGSWEYLLIKSGEDPEWVPEGDVAKEDDQT